jgi:hypothetical protein
MFSVASAPRLCNEDPRPARITEGVSWDEVEDDWEDIEMSSVEIWKSACEEKILHVIVTVLKSVARLRLVKTESKRFCNGEL